MLKQSARSEKGREIHAHRRIRRQDHDPFFIRAREEHRIEAELRRGAHHTCRFHAAELGFLDLHFADLVAAGNGGIVLRRDTRAMKSRRDDHAGHAGLYVRRARHDLHRRFLSHIELAHHKVIRVGMFLHGKDLPGDDAVDAFAGVDHVFHRNPVHGERFRHFFRVKTADIHKSIEPFQRSIHL